MTILKIKFLLVFILFGSVAYGATTVTVSPSAKQVATSATFSVDVTVNSVLKLHAASVQFKFNNTILRYTGITQGPFLSSNGDQAFFSSHPAASPTDTMVTVDQAILGLGKVSGSGTLFTINFTALQAGADSIKIVLVDLRDSANVLIPSTAIGGRVTIGLPVFSVSPGSLSFGNVINNRTKRDSVTVTNTGGLDLHVTSVTPPDNQFIVSPSSSTISALASVKFYVDFAPTSLGAKGGNVTFVHDATGSPSTVTVSGTSVLPSYTLGLTASHGSISASPNLAQYDSNTTVQLTPVAATGYHFVNWTGDATGSANPITVTMNANKTITANFALNQYALNITAVNGSVIQLPNLSLYDTNTTVQLTAVPATGYHFVNWTGDASGSANPLSVVMNAAKNVTAVFALNQYALGITAVNGVVNRSPSQTLYDTNTVVQLTAVPAQGYHFVNWSGDIAGSANPASITMNSNKTVTANFAINQYSLGITAVNGTVAKSPNQLLYDTNTTVQLTATPGPGYHFAGWSGDATGSANPLLVAINGNKAITAMFSVNQYSLTVTAVHGTGTKNPNQQLYDSNTTVQLSATPDPGYHFVNWSGDASGSANPISVTVARNLVITANFAINQFAISITAVNGTVTKTPDQLQYDSNTVVQLSAIPASGYHFVNWTGDVTGSSNPASVTMSAARNITAHFAINQYSLVISAVNGAVTKAPDQLLYDSNTVVQLTAVPSAGFHFTGWAGDVVSANNPLLLSMNHNTNISATFSVNQFSFTITALNGVVLRNPNQAFYDSNSTVQLTAVPATGYHFVNWTGAVTGSQNPASVVMNGNKTLTASFAINQYSLALTAVNGTVARNPDQILYDSNATVQLTATPAIGYHFVGWSGNFGGSANPVLVTMNGNKAITATFSINQYAVNITAVHGSVTRVPDQTQYDSNTVVQLTAVPATGYHFVNWSGDATGTGSPVSITVNAVKNVTAVFAINIYTITATVRQPNGTITPSGVVNINHGADTSFVILPNIGYRVDSIFIDGVAQAGAGRYTFTGVSQNHTIAANFDVTKLYQAKYRTFAYDSLLGTKPVRKKPEMEYFEFLITNTNTQEISEININFHYDVSAIVSSGSMTASGSRKKWQLSGTLAPGDTFTLKGYGSRAVPMSMNQIWLGPRSGRAAFQNVLATVNRGAMAMPNAVTVRDELFRFYAAERAALIVGVVKKDSSQTYGWVRIAAKRSFSLSLFDRTVHTAINAGFQTYNNGLPFRRGQTSLRPSKQNNKTFADLMVLKFNLALSERGITPPGLGDLLYVEPTSSFAGLTVRSIASLGDSMMTLARWSRFHSHPEMYGQLDTALMHINAAFSGEMDTLSWGDTLKLAGTRPLIDVGMFRSSGIAPSIAPVFADGQVDNTLPVTPVLYQNYPNPFNPTTTIGLDLPEDGLVTLKVYNILGQEVASVIDNQVIDAGTREIRFDASNMASGVYIYRVTVQPIGDSEGLSAQTTYVNSRKMLLLR